MPDEGKPDDLPARARNIVTISDRTALASAIVALCREREAARDGYWKGIDKELIEASDSVSALEEQTRDLRKLLRRVLLQAGTHAHIAICFWHEDRKKRTKGCAGCEGEQEAKEGA